MRRLLLSLTTFGLLTGCVSKTEHEELQAKVAQMEQKIAEMEKAPAKAAASNSPSANAAPVDQAAEEAAINLYKEIDELVAKAQFTPAKAKLSELLSKYGNTKAAARAVRLKAELDVVGKKVSNPEIESWFVGSGSDLELAEGATLVVFWEVWCPHCKREVPKIQETYTKYQGKMKVVGLTKITKSATPEKVTEFIKEQNITYPIAKETGKASEEFAVSGIPAAAIVKDGTVVWRGHPGKLNDELINQLIQG